MDRLAKEKANRAVANYELQKMKWEPKYGFLSEDRIRVASALEAVRRRICAYGPNAEHCDCKYGFGQSLVSKVQNSEMTGCPELRSAISIVLYGREDELNG